MKGIRHCKLVMQIVVIVFCFCSSTAFADQMSLLINGTAIHFKNKTGEKLNENNWGAGFQYDFDSKYSTWSRFVTASGFIDSFSEPSYYFGGGYQKRYNLSHIYPKLQLRAGIVGFVMWRNEYKNGDQPFLGILPVLTIGTKRVGLNLTYVPKFQDNIVSSIFLQLKISMPR